MKRWTDLYDHKDLILYQDDHLVVCNKPPGVPAQPDKSGDYSMLSWLEQHFKSNVHLLSRLDRPVSGAMVCSLKAHDTRTKIRKYYLAITTPPQEKKSTLKHYLKKDGRHLKTRIVDQSNGKLSTLTYEVVQHMDRYAVLEVKTESGRFHQIRAQLSHIGCPIKGDVKYGARRGNPDRSIDLHAHRLSFKDRTIQAPLLGRDGIWSYLELDKKAT